IVLNPKLRARFLQESLDRSSAGSGLIAVEIGLWNVVLGALLWIMIQIAREQYGARFAQFQKKNLVAWRVPGSRFDNHGGVAKDVEFVSLEDYRLAVLQRAESFRCKAARNSRRLREHGIALFLPHEPRGAGKIVRVCGVI